MAKVILTREALTDLDDMFWFGLNSFGPSQAQAYLRRMEHVLDYLADQPLMGPGIDKISPGLRRLVIERHVAFYRVDGQTVSVIRVLHHRVNAEAELELRH